MGKLINGINGPFLGKVGNGIGSSWKGIPYIKGPYKKRTGKASEGEKGNRNKFGMAQRWLQPALPFVREGFKNYSPTVDGFLAAKSWLLLHSFEGIQPDISINPALVKLSHGSQSAGFDADDIGVMTAFAHCDFANISSTEARNNLNCYRRQF